MVAPYTHGQTRVILFESCEVLFLSLLFVYGCVLDYFSAVCRFDVWVFSLRKQVVSAITAGN